MTTGSIGPGTVLAGRYRLDDLLTESDGRPVLACHRHGPGAQRGDPRRTQRRPAGARPARGGPGLGDRHRPPPAAGARLRRRRRHHLGGQRVGRRRLARPDAPAGHAAALARRLADPRGGRGDRRRARPGRRPRPAEPRGGAGHPRRRGQADRVRRRRQPRGAPGRPDPLYGELDEREADVINLAGILYAGADRPVAGRRPRPPYPRRRGRVASSAAPAPGPRRRTAHPGRDLRAGAAQGGLAARDADRDRPRDRRRPGRLRRRPRHWPRRSTPPACTPSRRSRSTATPCRGRGRPRRRADPRRRDAAPTPTRRPTQQVAAARPTRGDPAVSAPR